MLILAGGGNPQEVVEIDDYFAGFVDKTKKVIYIPIAMEPECFTYEECYKWFASVYSNYGIVNFEMWTELKNRTLNCDEVAGVFIGGGNTFKLLKYIKDTGFDKVLKQYIDNNGIVYGGSAGAIILGKTIGTATHADKNNVNLIDFSGLNCLYDYDIWCHYTDEDEQLVLGYEYPLIIMHKNSGLVVNRNGVIELEKNIIKKSNL